jgi:cytochrome P450
VTAQEHKTEVQRHANSTPEPSVDAESRPVGLFPTTFESDYVAGAIAPFLLSSSYIGETPSLPMIDFALSKEKAVPIQLWGLLYDGWGPNPEQEGITVFMQGYENRGPNNERKKIYVSAVTPDLIATKYRGKLTSFFEKLFLNANAGKPLMHTYFDNYYDLYWNLHVGVTGDAIPPEVRQFSAAFNAVLGFLYPTSDIVHQNYMRARETRQALKDWLDTRVQAIIDGTVPNADRTFVYYWLKNGRLGENFRRKDIVFECFHNFLAFSQWGNMVYNTAARLAPNTGDSRMRTWFERTMANGQDEVDGTFTPLDRFVMELFRVISPNGGSLSTPERRRQLLGSEYTSVLTPHLPASTDPRHWSNPGEFDPDRYKTAPTTVDNDAARAKENGMAHCPFPQEAFAFKDGRQGQVTNSAFGAVYAVVEETAHPLCDAAGYAPFGFGYRRCAGEYITVEFIKEFLRAVWNRKISFVKLDLDAPEKVPVNPGTVLNDEIAFTFK